MSDDRVLVDGHPFVPYRPDRVGLDEARARGAAWFHELDQRRSVRSFSDTPVPRDLIETAIRTASTAPSGAHKQPWTFVAISDPELKQRIREAAEEEEKALYTERISEEWGDALAPLGTNWEKPHLTDAPWVVVVFAQTWGIGPEGEKIKHYYVRESVGIACGLFIAALHRVGLASLTHTPSPMGFLCKLLDRPSNEKAFILFPIGYPAEDCLVPDLARKSLDQVAVWHSGK